MGKGKDITKRHRRTKAEIEEEIRIKEEKIREQENNAIEKIYREKYCLIPRELVSMAGLDEDEIISNLVARTLKRIEKLTMEK